ncbi:GAF domain-containing protein [Paracoccus sp. MBLB3053]|uniref:GAF domain-containing protein n=1 Tax=Paracoccus aurantius TaxID=3073814 RepID=A0ABU2HW78_9RHOB|nr:GAF domain-containing protein [Paracoccus sp. MBLB3053]MDS9469302.1 GAF domain-containing protein [Paracoccus sp. MBLB3053]
MSLINMDVLRRSLEGIIPSVLATCDLENVPNVSLISQVHYVDCDHVALSYQFFNKTRQNLLATGSASVVVIDPVTMMQHRLSLDYVETRTEGPIFESMKARLAGIASHAGMADVFKLLGSDLFRVREIEQVPAQCRPEPYPERDLLLALRLTCRELSAVVELGTLLDRALDCLERYFGIARSMALMLDPDAARLFTLASHGYSPSGIGSEVLLGEGVIGVAARQDTAIRIGHMTREYGYGEAVRNAAIRSGLDWQRATEITFPGLAEPASQIAVPIRSPTRLIGVLFCESEQSFRFWHDDETALSILADHLGALIELLPDRAGTADPPIILPRPGGENRVVIRHFAQDDSIFLGNDYLIKGVAGAILLRLVRERIATGRDEFTTRELRLDPSLRLPDNAENLDARLVLLRKRLEEREACLRIEKSGRGRFRLCTASPLVLQSIAGTPG